MQNTFERLHAMAAAHAAALGAAHPLLAAAIASGDEGVALAAIAYVEKTTPKETVGLAAIAHELSADDRVPSLWASLEVARPEKPVAPFAFNESVMHSSYAFRRESPTGRDGRPIAFRIISPAPGGISGQHLEALGRFLYVGSVGGIGSQAVNSFFGAPRAEDARAALIAAAAQRSTK